MPLIHASLLKVIGELDNQDAILGDQSDQCDQSDLAVDVDAGRAQKGEEKGSRQRQWHRSKEDDEGVTEAFKLRGQHEEDQDEGENHRGNQGVALLAELT